jgi:hypothetical protein
VADAAFLKSAATSSGCPARGISQGSTRFTLGRVSSPGRGPFNPETRIGFPNGRDKEPELPLLEAFVILLMLGLFLLLLFLGGLYWF